MERRARGSPGRLLSSVIFSVKRVAFIGRPIRGFTSQPGVRGLPRVSTLNDLLWYSISPRVRVASRRAASRIYIFHRRADAQRRATVYRVLSRRSITLPRTCRSLAAVRRLINCSRPGLVCLARGA